MTMRHQFARVIKEYIAGDRALVEEITANTTSNSQLAQLACGGMTPPAGEDETDMLRFKRSRKEFELFKIEEEIKRMTQTRITSPKKELEQLDDHRLNKMEMDKERLGTAGQRDSRSGKVDRIFGTGHILSLFI